MNKWKLFEVDFKIRDYCQNFNIFFIRIFLTTPEEVNFIQIKSD